MRPMRRAIGILIKYLISPRDLRARVTHSGHNERRSLAAGSLFKVWRVRSLKFAPLRKVRRHGEYFPASLWKQTNFRRGFLRLFTSTYIKAFLLEFASHSEFTRKLPFLRALVIKNLNIKCWYFPRTSTLMYNSSQKLHKNYAEITLCFTHTLFFIFLFAGVTASPVNFGFTFTRWCAVMLRHTLLFRWHCIPFAVCVYETRVTPGCQDRTATLINFIIERSISGWMPHQRPAQIRSNGGPPVRIILIGLRT